MMSSDQSVSLSEELSETKEMAALATPILLDSLNCGTNDDTLTTDDGLQTLCSASSGGNLPAVQLLLKGGCSVDAVKRNELSPLHLAAGSGHVDIVWTLVASGASLNLTGSNGRTAIYMAAENGHLNCLMALLNAHADSNIPNDKGLTPMCVAVLNNHTSVALKLLSHSISCINVCDYGNSLPLHHAVRNGNTRLVTALLAAGSRRNVLNKNFESPVHIAVLGPNLDVLQLLVNGGCDVNFCEPVGNVTPLHVSVNMHSDINLFRPLLQLLLQGGCILNWRAFSTLETPLYRSLCLEKIEISQELVSHGADPNLASPFDITALQRACQKGSFQLINLLLNCGIIWKRERWLHHNDAACKAEIIELIDEWRNNVVSLQGLCRIRIRNVLEKKLESKLNQLALPQKIRDYILLRDLM